ncbi:ammonium transporter [Kerstersia sp.]|uniref:ammonium transporter n=1 Tax=Kerstersia sp. TaxID=1930783 RepID=UPI003F93B06D
MENADIAWLSVSTLLVLMMVVPGLALFYGGMVRAKNVLSVLMQTTSVFCLAVVLWFVYGYSLAFTDGNAFFGGFSKLFLTGLFNAPDSFAESGSIPELLFAAFQATFAGITCALIIGGFAERARFSAVLVFTFVWFTLAYVPIAHMVWYGGDVPGLLFAAGALDFAGGTVVHINSGIAALTAAALVGKRLGYGKEALQPHNLPMTYIGAAVLWVGWFGFNAGSALAANNTAVLAFMNTLIATAIAVLAWSVMEKLLKGRSSLLGAASGAIAGLVGITPAAGLVGPVGALIIGLIAGVACAWSVTYVKHWLRIDDALDVFCIHGIGGIIGAILTGIFNAQALGGPGITSAEIPAQIWTQVEGVLLTIVWSGIAAFIAYYAAKTLCGSFRVSEEDERAGLDIATHGESAYRK